MKTIAYKQTKLMNTKLVRMLMPATVAAAVLLGYCVGQKRPQSTPKPLEARVESEADAQVTTGPLAQVTPPTAAASTPVSVRSDSDTIEAHPAPTAPVSTTAPTATPDADALPNDVQALFEAHQQFRNWLESHPEQGQAETLQWLRAAPSSELNLSSMVFESITESGNEGARAAVLSVLREPDSFSPGVVLQAAQAAGDLADAQPAGLRDTLRQLVEAAASPESAQLSDAAIYSLARLSRQDEVTQQYLVERLKPALGSGRSPEEGAHALALLTMAEAYDPDLLAQATRLASSDQEEIRVAAQEYVDRIQPNVADEE